MVLAVKKYLNNSKALIQLVPFAFFIFFLYVGKLGLDFGNHWDEYGNHIAPMKHAIETGSLLPHWYWMPSFNHDLALFNLIPSIVSYVLEPITGSGTLSEFLLKVVDQPEFIFEMRWITCVITGLSIFWIFNACYRLTSSFEAASFACALMASSWEVSYHARWYTADPIVMQFLSLALVGVVSSNSLTQSPLKLAAFATGLACSTKYPAGAFMVSVLILQILLAYKEPLVNQLSKILNLCVIFLLTYVALTPGTIFDIGLFLRDVYQQKLFYESGNGVHTVPLGLPHLGVILQYLVIALPSRYFLSSVFYIFLAILGFLILSKGYARLSLSVLAFSVFYIGYIAFTKKIMHARNFLLFAPIIFLLAAYGYYHLLEVLKSPLLRWLARGTVLFTIVINLLWVFSAGKSIYEKNGINTALSFQNYLDEDETGSVFVSQAIREKLEWIKGATQIKKVCTLFNDTRCDFVAVYATEAALWPGLVANDPFLTENWFGPREVNYNYYPHWMGDNRIVIFKKHRALELGATSNVGAGELEKNAGI